MTVSTLISDQKERDQALNIQQSYIIQAPAGSGKTELLIQRYLKLLSHVKSPDEILAITFTKKAANEMRERIIKALHEANNQMDTKSLHQKHTQQLAMNVLAKDKQLSWQILENPNQLRIQTIDAFCSYLAKQSPLSSRLGTEPHLTEDPKPLYVEAVEEALSHLEDDLPWSQEISKLLLYLDNDINSLQKLLINLLAKRDQWLNFIKFHDDNISVKVTLELQLGNIIKEHLNKLCAHLKEKFLDQELIILARYAASHVDKISPFYQLLNLLELPNKTPQDVYTWRIIAQLLLTSHYQFRKKVDKNCGFPISSPSKKNADNYLVQKNYKERFLKLLDSIRDDEKLRQTLENLYFLETTYTSEHWEILQSLLHVLKVLSALLRLVFQKHNVIDFIENAQAAFLTLGTDEEPTDLTLQLDYQIRHILVDEFQDTSLFQYRLLQKLIAGWEMHDGRTLFVVGDPMQSIYRFREADVGIFLKICEEGIGQIKLIPLSLTVNFRSIASLVSWNNKHFSKIFPSHHDPKTGAVSYHASIACDSNTSSQSVHFQGYVNSEEGQQAKGVVDLIVNRQIAYPHEKIAILVRGRNHLTEIIPALKAANISYSAIDIDPLSSKQCLQDIFALISALNHPADRLAWLSILRAPWCGLTLNDLTIIVGNNPHDILWERMNDIKVQSTLSQDGQLRLTRLLNVLQHKLTTRDREPLRAWIESTWVLLGGPATLQNDSDIEEVQVFFNAIESFNQTHSAWNLAQLHKRMNHLYANSNTEANLQIMTIHSAKGLEFDTVIVPFLEREGANDKKPILQWIEQPLQNSATSLLLAPVHKTGSETKGIYQYISRQQQLRHEYEMSRLLYVACTRAKSQLFLFFNIKKNDKDEYHFKKGIFLEKLWPFIANDVKDNLIQKENFVTEKQPKRRYIKRLSRHWVNPISETTQQQFQYHQQPSGFLFKQSTHKIIGIVVHAILQQIAQLGIAWWQNYDKEARLAYIVFQLQQRGAFWLNIQETATRILAIVDNAMNDSKGQWILFPHKQATCELAITCHLSGKIENLVIDRTFIDESGFRWIIDYKTTTFSSNELKDFLTNEAKKYQEKMHSYREAFRAMQDHPIKLGLYFPAIPAWHEWE